MTLLRITLTTVALTLTLTACTAPREMATGPTALEDVPVVETYATFDFRPGNIGIAPTGKMLMSGQPLGNPQIKLVQVHDDGSYTPYPNDAFAKGADSELQAVIAVKVDDNGIAWVLDMGARKLIAIDTTTDTITRRITIDPDALTEFSFLQDFALDQKRNRIIIADMTQGDLKSAPEPAFVVVDLDSETAARVAQSHPSMMPDTEDGFALNPITISSDYQFVYYGALNGSTMYRVPAASFDGDASRVASSIEAFSSKSFNDGQTIDDEGNIYVADVQQNAFGVISPEGDFRLIGRLPAGQSWTDGITVGPDGYLYSTANQLDRTAALAGAETGTGEYLVVRFKPLAPASTGR